MHTLNPRLAKKQSQTFRLSCVIMWRWTREGDKSCQSMQHEILPIKMKARQAALIQEERSFDKAQKLEYERMYVLTYNHSTSIRSVSSLW